MEEIPPPSPAEVRPKTVAGQFIERVVAWVVIGGFVFGILGAAFVLIAVLFLEWEVSKIWELSPIFTGFLVGTILGAIIGLLIGVIGGVIRFSDPTNGKKGPPCVPP